MKALALILLQLAVATHSFAYVPESDFPVPPSTGDNPPPEGCYKEELQGETYTWVAEVPGEYTFKGGSESSPSGYLITVHLSIAELWMTPPGTVAISFVIVCPDPVTTTSTSTSTSTSTTTTLPGCFYKDPARVQFRRGSLDQFKVHAYVIPKTPVNLVDDGVTFRLSNMFGDVFQRGFPGYQFSPVGRSTFAYKTESSIVRLTSRLRDGRLTYAFKIKVKTDLALAVIPLMTMDLAIGNDKFKLTASWRKRGNGWVLRGKDYSCEE